MSTIPTVEMTLDNNSVIRKIMETGTVTDTPMVVETDFNDEEYNTMMSNFLNKMRLQGQELNKESKPKEKIQSIREQLADNRRPLKFRKGFLNSKHSSVG